MNIRYVVFLTFTFLFVGCEFFSSEKKDSDKNFNTVVDFTQVDVSPVFDNCKELSDSEKATCFREEIHTRITSSLQEYQFVSEENINELVVIDLLIDINGNCILKKINTNDEIINQFPQLKDAITFAIESLPKVIPAKKQDISVATQYTLPIKITVK
ncbi:hypothetical protein [Tenacibaculum crassostreae]|uniref:hypothetical protein n=1 Tax=Tenacibaculum crassostreae TaxID=502683 RepID=UPI0038945422